MLIIKNIKVGNLNKILISVIISFLVFEIAYAQMEINMNGAKTDLKIIQARKAQVEHLQQQEDVDRTQEAKEEATYQPQPQAQQQQVKPDPLAQEWFDKNSWFGKDEIATAVAITVDQKLKNEGYDPNTKEFYNEIDRLVNFCVYNFCK